MKNKRCKNCNKKLSAKRIKRAMSRRGSSKDKDRHNIYCDNKCFREYRVKMAYNNDNSTCPECGVKWRKGRSNHRCNECRAIAFSNYYFDSDIIKLVLLNPGVGKRYFVYNLGYQGPSLFLKGAELIEFLEAIGEFHKVDYVSILETRVRMRKMKVKDLTPELKRFATHKSITASSKIVAKGRARAEGRDPSEVAGSNVTTYVPAEFIWGDVKKMSEY